MSVKVSTLVSEVHLTQRDGSVRMKDVGTRIQRGPRGRTFIEFGFARSYPVVVAMTEAERIALIEALGGQA